MSRGDASRRPHAEVGWRREQADEEDLVAQVLVREPERAEEENEAGDPVASFCMKAAGQSHSILSTSQGHSSLAPEAGDSCALLPSQHREDHRAEREVDIQAIHVLEQNACWPIDVRQEKGGGGGGGGRDRFRFRVILVLDDFHHCEDFVCYVWTQRAVGNLDVEVEFLPQRNLEQHRLVAFFPRRHLAELCQLHLLCFLIPHPLARDDQSIPQVERDHIVELFLPT
mmetsp:Transcript_26354/g.59882  ORF Transcript_26354/g.59882 Transcript_26354/m.59882 type:complete len:227 (-) Transcript_26354:2388-3068(-)